MGVMPTSVIFCFMERTDFTQYDIKPEAMVNYLRYNGPHFSSRLAMFAISQMRKDGKKLIPIKQEELERILKDFKISLENAQLSDALYVINMGKADFYGTTITDESRLAKFVKDYIDDEDGYDGLPFTRWYADVSRKGIAIDWEKML